MLIRWATAFAGSAYLSLGGISGTKVVLFSLPTNFYRKKLRNLRRFRSSQKGDIRFYFTILRENPLSVRMK